MNRVVYLSITIVLLLLTGCRASQDDLSQFIAQSQLQTPAQVTPPKPLSPMQQVQYNRQHLPSPFAPASTDALATLPAAQSHCLAPNYERTKERTEAYGLDALTFTGIIDFAAQRYALFKSNDGVIHKVATGNYIGLFNGRINAITSEHVEITQLIPDGTGCFQQQTSRVSLGSSSRGTDDV